MTFESAPTTGMSGAFIRTPWAVWWRSSCRGGVGACPFEEVKEIIR
ncbi:MAG: hypothetical protein ACYCSX_01555 [Acidimicrobiales bacterium]